ncbi:MAG: type I DNA topoisomerase [Alphaproteobacteria bacterium]
MNKNVIIVESPAKAQTISRYLENKYTILASYGHVRDLPSKSGSVRPENDLEMIWDVNPYAQKHINTILANIKDADEIYLATDPDREGEAIAWHIYQILKDKKSLKNKTVKRIIFHEVTKNAVNEALLHPKELDQSLIDAYLARRALDYLVGFTLSPILWRKLPGSRSAGRVQSVALRLIVEREKEIEIFKIQEYWTVKGIFQKENKAQITAFLRDFNGKKLEKFDIPNQEKASFVQNELLKQKKYYISSIKKKTIKRTPPAPFITSTLQQEGITKLYLSANKVMQTAQRLYEGVDIKGERIALITYMRTDNTNLSKEAIQNIRFFLKKHYKNEYLPKNERLFKNKVKNAQEAHEAIRPVDITKTPKDILPYLDAEQGKLYELIWKRTLASQMEVAIFDQTSVDFTSENKKHTFHATGSTLVFDGFLTLYKKDDQDTKNILLPPLNEGEILDSKTIIPEQHFTQPPPRYNEATLVKKLEELGIGRPSTYAPIMQVLKDRKYVHVEKKCFIPEDRGWLVTVFLIHFFEKYVEYDFTANLEEELDHISSGKEEWKKAIMRFWEAFTKVVKEAEKLRITDVLNILEKDLSFHIFKGGTNVCPKCKKGIASLKLGKFGAFLGCSLYPECKYTHALGQSSDDKEEIVQKEPQLIGKDPETSEDITLNVGPYGPYLQWNTKPEANAKKNKKPKRVALPKNVDPSSVTLLKALFLKALPKEIGIYNKNPIMLHIGRFGPYLKCGDNTAAIPKNKDIFCFEGDDLVSILESAKTKKKRKKK